jgi:hypothetical protein
LDAAFGTIDKGIIPRAQAMRRAMPDRGEARLAAVPLRLRFQ